VWHISPDMQSSVIVWDLETVPDLVGFAAANDLVGKSAVEVREAIGDKFPKRCSRAQLVLVISDHSEQSQRPARSTQGAR